MGLLRSIAASLGLGRRGIGAVRRFIRAKFDAAGTSPENRRHWLNADGLSPDAALSPTVRRLLRQRSRYEVANNCYAEGMVDTLAMDIVGSGPTLQLALQDEAANEAVEQAFLDWSEEVDLPGKLLLAARSKVETGETFIVLTTNPKLNNPVQLDLKVIEADQVASPYANATATPGQVDGIEYDEFGNPLRYSILNEHPGSGLPGALTASYLPATHVLHFFRPKRPSQSRGYPDLAPALPLFAFARRYTLATVQAAENAANYSAVIKTNAAADDETGEADSAEPFETYPVERGMIATLPMGWDITQLKPEQPAQGFAEFVKGIFREMARVIKMPFNIAAGDSSGYNYASGRLDHQTYDRSLEVERSFVERKLLRRIFLAWFAEARLIEGLLPEAVRDMVVRPAWIWSRREHVDPVKEATADAQGIANSTVTRTEILARKGKDFREVAKKIAEERELMKSLGIPLDDSPFYVDQTKDDEEDTTPTAAPEPSKRKERRRAA